MNRDGERTAICIVRLERQPGGALLISLRLNLDIEEASGEWGRSFADREQAVSAVRDFIETYRALGTLDDDDELPPSS